MPRKRQWTDADQDLLRAMTAEGKSTDVCAAYFGVSKQYLRRVRREFGIVPPVPTRHIHIGEAVPPPQPKPSREQNWWPLRAGSPESWGAISNQPWPGA